MPPSAIVRFSSATRTATCLRSSRRYEVARGEGRSLPLGKPPDRSVGDVRTWHETDMPTLLGNVRSQEQSGKHMLASSFSALDPERTWTPGPATRVDPHFWSVSP